MLRLKFIVLLNIFAISAQAQGFGSVQQFGNVIYNYFNAANISRMIKDANGNHYVVGSFTGTIDVDPGPGVYNLTEVGYFANGYASGNGFIIKEDSSGNFIWAKQIKGLPTAYQYANIYNFGMALDPSGNIIISCTVTDTFDFDTGPNNYLIGTSTANTSVIFKLDTAGNFIGAKQLGLPSTNSTYATLSTMQVNNKGEYYLIYGFKGTVDFDPGPNVYNLTSSYSPYLTTSPSDIAIQKLDSSFNLEWVKQIGGLNYKAAVSSILDTISDLYFCGIFEDTCDFDPGPSVANLISNGSNYSDIFIEKLDSAGNYVWAKRIGGLYEDEPNDIKLDPIGNILVSGYFEGTVDFDPDTSVYNLNNPLTSNQSPFILKLNNSGNFVFAKTIYSYGGCTINSITSDNLGNVFTTGKVESGDYFNLGSLGNYYLGNPGVLLYKMDSFGNFISARSFGSNSSFGKWIGLYGNSIYITGIRATGTGDWDPCIGVDTVTLSAGSFIEKLIPYTNLTPTASITGDTEVCQGSLAHFTLNNPVPGTKVKWFVNHIFKDTNSTSYNYFPSNDDTVFSQITLPSWQCYDVPFIYTNSIIVQVDTNVVPIVNITAPTVVQVGQQVTVNATITNAPPIYNISWENNASYLAITTTPFVTYTKLPGTDKITAVLSPLSGCYTSAATNILYINAIDGIDQINNPKGLQVFPNPSSGVFNFESTSIIESITITDVTGKTVYQDKPNTQKLSIDLSQEASGVYLYQVIINHQKITGKLIFNKEVK